jgi:polyferredoxin
MACVNVCPTGIDIRNGPQLECITCALCIDACNEVMDKLGRTPFLAHLPGRVFLTNNQAIQALTPEVCAQGAAGQAHH